MFTTDSKKTENHAKHLAHVFLDSEIGGTPLEGAQPTLHIQFLNSFLKQFDAPTEDTTIAWIIKLGHLGLGKNENTILEKIHKTFSTLSEIDKIDSEIVQEIKRTCANPAFDPTKIEDVVTNNFIPYLRNVAQEQVKHLHENKEIFLSGGWSGGKRKIGHQMFYHLVEQDDKVLFYIYNTGSGVEFHSTTVKDNGKLAYYPIYGIRLAKNSYYLTCFIEQLFKPKYIPLFNSYSPETLKTKKYSVVPEDIYTEALRFAAIYLNAEVIPGSELAKPVLSQRSGTCSFKSLKQLFLKQLTDGSLGRLFFLSYRLYLLNQEFSNTNIQENETMFPGYRNILKGCLTNTARMLDKTIKPHLEEWKLTEEDEVKIINLLHSWRKKLKKIPHHRVSYFLSQDYDHQPANVENVPKWNFPDAKEIITEKNIPVIPKKIILSTDFIQALKQADEYFKLDNLNADYEIIEQFCTQFSDTSKPLSIPSSEPPEDVLTLMKNLLNHFNHSYARVNKSVALVYLGLICIMNRICDEKFFSVSSQFHLEASSFDLNSMRNLVNEFKINVFMGTRKANLDLLLSGVVDYYKNKSVKSRSQPSYVKYNTDNTYAGVVGYLTYYSDIINEMPDAEKEIIRKTWTDEASNNLLAKKVQELFKPDFAYAYSWLSRMELSNKSDRIQNELNCPTLQKMMNLQMGIEKFILTCRNAVTGDSEYNEFYLSYNALQDHIQFRPFLINNQEKHDSKNYSITTRIFPQIDFKKKPIIDSLHNRYPVIANSQEEKLTKLLSHIRKTPHCQLVLLLGEISHHPNWLIDPEWQTFILLNFFQPTILLSSLQSHTDLWSIFKKLIPSNHQENPDKELTEGEWFLLKLAFKISCYASELQDNHGHLLLDHEKSAVLHWQNTMLTAMDKRLDNSLIDEASKYELHLLRIEAMLALKSDDYSKLIHSYFLSSLLHAKNPIETEKFNQILKKTALYFQDAFDNGLLSIKQCEKIGLQLVASLSKNLDDLNDFFLDTQSVFPTLIFKNHQDKTIIINFLERIITIDNTALVSLPSAVMTSEYNAIFNNENRLALKSQGDFCGVIVDRYAWSFKNEKYRLLGNTLLQKEVDGSWYTLLAPTESLKNKLNFKNEAFSQCHPLFTQNKMIVWFKDKDNYFIIDQKTQEILYHQTQGKLIKISSLQGEVIKDKLAPELLLRIEDRTFMECVIGEDGAERWFLPRYNKCFVKIGDFYFTDDRLYKLVKPDNTVFSTGVILQSQKEPQQRYLMMPVQRLYQAKKNNKPVAYGASYYWVHDITNELVQNDKGRPAEDLDAFRDVKKRQQGWDYDNSEITTRFLMQGNELLGETPADQIYLAYLYLASGETKKALQLIRTCQFQGTYTEIERLHWIIHWLSDLKNSPLIAAQMLVFYSLLQIKQQFPTLLNDLLQLKKNSPHSIKEFDCNTVIHFFEKIYIHCALHYQHYDNYQNNIPTAMRLKPFEEAFLLSYCHSHNSHITDLTESNLIKARYGQFFYENPHSVSMPQEDPTVLYKKTFISPENWVDDWKKMQYRFISNDDINVKKLQETQENQRDVMVNIILNENEHLLFQYIPIFLDNIRNKEEKNYKENIEYLTHFCTALISVKSYKMSKHTNNLFKLFAEILWSAIHAPNKLPDGKIFDSDKDNKNLNIFADEIVSLEDTIPHINRIKLDKFYSKKEINIKPKKINSRPALPLNDVQTPSPINPFKFSGRLYDLHHKLQFIEEEYQDKLSAVRDKLKSLSQLSIQERENQFKKFDHEILSEFLEKQDKQQRIYDQHLHVGHAVFKDELSNQIKSMELDEKNSEDEIQNILNSRKPDIIAELGKQISVPSINKLLHHYANNTEIDYTNMGIPIEYKNQLQSDLNKLLQVKNSIFRLKQCQQALEKDEKNSTETTRQQVITCLLSQNNATRKHEMVLQYAKQLSLRLEQAELLNLLATSNNRETLSSYVMQLIMGGGKTKVILPLMLYSIADGDRFPVVIVPEMLLDINFNDLRACSATLNQTPYLFHFDRESDCSPSALKILYETFELVRLSGGYVVTSPHCLQSLELKLLEFLHHTNNSFYIDEQSEWLKKILLILRKNGYAIIDESHQLLDIRKELTYSLTGNEIVSRNTIETTVFLYQWLLSEASSQDNNFSAILKDPEKINDKTTASIMQRYVQLLCQQRPKWMRNIFVADISNEQYEKYLLSQLTEAEEDEFYNPLEKYPELKERWIVLRQQFSIFLPITLKQKLHVNYGPSKKEDNQEAGTFFAVHYRASNTPTKCVFGNFFETMNYTIQMVMIEGVSFKAFKELISEWKKSAIQALAQNGNEPILGLENFNNIVKEKSLLDIDLENLHELHKTYCKNPMIIQHVLLNEFAKLNVDSVTMSINPINLVDMFAQVTALSGTPTNYPTYHAKVKMENKTRLLVENKIAHYLIKQAAPLYATEIQDGKTFLQDMVAKQPQAKALIDSGGWLQGLSNEEVASILSHVLPDSIRFILFFQEMGLYALSVKTKEVKKLTSTDADTIYYELDHCDPQERFTYYDQEHTLGSDIKQAETALAVVTTSLEMELNTFLQAVMRMRELALNQKFIIYLSPLLQQQVDLNLSKLLDFFKKNEVAHLQKESFKSIIKQSDNVFRNHIFNLILNSSTDLIVQLLKKTNAFFFNKQGTDIISSYEKQARLKPTLEVINAHIEKNWNYWEKSLIEMNMRDELTSQNQKIRSLLNEIIDLADKICLATQLDQPASLGKAVQVQKQQKTQLQNQQFLEQRQQVMSYTATESFPQLNWVTQFIDRLKNHANSKPYYQMDHLNIDMGFDSNLMVSPSYQFNYQHICPDILTSSARPGLIILFQLKDNDQITGCLLFAEEADLLQRELSKITSPSAWLMSLHGFPTTQMPSLSLEQKKQVNNFLSQFAYLSGRVDILMSNPERNWLNQRSMEKIDFLRKKLPIFYSTENQIDKLEINLFKLDSYIEEWSNLPLHQESSNLIFSSLPILMRQRADDIIDILIQTRKTLEVNDADYTVIPSRQDYLLIQTYRDIFIFLKKLNAGNFEQAAAIYQKSESWPLRFLNFNIPNKPIVISINHTLEIMKLLQLEKDKIRWLLSCSEAKILILSRDDFFRYSSFLPDLQHNIKINYSAINITDILSYNIKNNFITNNDLIDIIVHFDNKFPVLNILYSEKITSQEIAKRMLSDNKFASFIKNIPNDYLQQTEDELTDLIIKNKFSDKVIERFENLFTQSVPIDLFKKILTKENYLTIFMLDKPNSNEEKSTPIMINISEKGEDYINKLATIFNHMSEYELRPPNLSSIYSNTILIDVMYAFILANSKSHLVSSILSTHANCNFSLIDMIRNLREHDLSIEFLESINDTDLVSLYCSDYYYDGYMYDKKEVADVLNYAIRNNVITHKDLFDIIVSFDDKFPILLSFYSNKIISPEIIKKMLENKEFLLFIRKITETNLPQITAELTTLIKKNQLSNKIIERINMLTESLSFDMVKKILCQEGYLTVLNFDELVMSSMDQFHYRGEEFSLKILLDKVPEDHMNKFAKIVSYMSENKLRLPELSKIYSNPFLMDVMYAFIQSTPHSAAAAKIVENHIKSELNLVNMISDLIHYNLPVNFMEILDNVDILTLTNYDFYFFNKIFSDLSLQRGKKLFESFMNQFGRDSLISRLCANDHAESKNSVLIKYNVEIASLIKTVYDLNSILYLADPHSTQLLQKNITDAQVSKIFNNMPYQQIHDLISRADQNTQLTYLVLAIRFYCIRDARAYNKEKSAYQGKTFTFFYTKEIKTLHENIAAVQSLKKIVENIEESEPEFTPSIVNHLTRELKNLIEIYFKISNTMYKEDTYKRGGPAK